MRLLIVTALAITGCLLLMTQGCAQKSNGQTVNRNTTSTAPEKIYAQEETCEHNEITGLAFSPDARQVFTSSPGLGLRLFDLESGKLIRRFGEGSQGLMGRVAFSPDGRRVLSYGYGTPIQVWDVQTGQAILRIPLNEGGTERAAFTPDGQHILSCDLIGGTIHLWSAQTGQEVKSFKVAGAGDYLEVGFSQDGRRALVITMDDTACLWDVERQRKFRCSSARDGETHISNDGGYGIISREGRVLRLLDIGSGVEMRAPETFKDEIITSLDKKGRRAFLDGETYVRMVEISDGRELSRLKFNEQDAIQTAVFTLDGRHALTGSFNGGLCLWDLQNGKRIRCFGAKDAAISNHQM